MNKNITNVIMLYFLIKKNKNKKHQEKNKRKKVPMMIVTLKLIKVLNFVKTIQKSLLRTV